MPRPEPAPTLPAEFIGVGEVKRVTELIDWHQAQRVLLVTGNDSFVSSGAQQAISKQLLNVQIRRFYDFDVNPKLDQAMAGIELMNRFEPHLLIAVGGGSVIDMAKILDCLTRLPAGADLGQLIQSNRYKPLLDAQMANAQPNTSQSNSARPDRALIAIPTTAGTGSEATHFAVIYIDGTKYSLAHPSMRPAFAIVDPDLTKTAPVAQAAVSGLDALTQATESYWAVGATRQSQHYARQAIHLILPALIPAVRHKQRRAMQDMALAANLAGKAINISKTTVPHALSYPVSAWHHVPHGHAVALTLGKCFELNAQITADTVNDPRGLAYVQQTMRELLAMYGCDDAISCKSKWHALVIELGLEMEPTSLGVNSGVLRDRIVRSVNVERLTNHPGKLTAEQLSQLLQ